jgi:hypothetical protein
METVKGQSGQKQILALEQTLLEALAQSPVRKVARAAKQLKVKATRGRNGLTLAEIICQNRLRKMYPAQ